MAASTGLLRVWGRRLSLGVPARRAFWGGQRKKEGDSETVDPPVAMKEEPAMVCPPLRSKKYLPPEDLQSRLESHVREILGSSVSRDWQKASLGDSNLKYRLLAQLADDLGHAVPNSKLHQMKSARDVLAFYSIPVKDISKFDELSTQELPPNLRIHWQY
ncbi:large ribosomal subunit protein mL50 [Elgaria multicarinata webbii]|uniref:large ribosomal subunit protein mL50 n=1 Tax=Elgaria multicarinata webbii TaxID=159646 RepID=UPI002FCD3C21